jgi:hypothetical protein
LTPPTRAGGASGTAILRLSSRTNSICWDILTSGVPPHPRAAVVLRSRVIARRQISAGRSDACVHYASPSWKGFAASFAAGRIHMKLEILGPGGADLLRGTIRRNPPDPRAWRESSSTPR